MFIKNDVIPIAQADPFLKQIITDQIKDFFQITIIQKINLVFTHSELFPYSILLVDPKRKKRSRTHQSKITLYFKGQVVGYLKIESLYELNFHQHSIVYFLHELIDNYLIMRMQVSNRNSLLKYMLRNLRIKDALTYRHVQQVRLYAIYLGEQIGLGKKDVESLGILASLHDIGKLAIPDSILKKPSSLSESELEVMQKHPVNGFDYLKSYKEFIDEAYIAFYHHERWDGLGYPYGLSAENIPIQARILAIADTFDAMTGLRLYREPLGVHEALKQIQIQSEKQFDPYLVNVFITGISKNL